jgi:hypothetical protein
MQHPMKRGSKPSVSWLASTAFALALAGVLTAAPAFARHPDLDMARLSNAQIEALLQAEMDDDDLVDCGLPNVRAAVPDAKMYAVIMCALGDEGDDESEQGLDLDDLVAEMTLSHTTLETVVWAAIQRADALALGAPLTAVDVRAAFGLGEPAKSVDAGAEAVLYAVDDGYVNPGKTAVPQVKVYVRQAIRTR